MTAFNAFETRASLMQAAAVRIADALQRGIAERGEGYAALSGGGTPAPAYKALAALALDWPRATFLLVDERFVPPSDPASNENMLRRTLAPALAAGAKLAAMYSDESLPAAAARADALYAALPIDIAIMGMGGDGHTASWFPQSAELQAALAPGTPRSVIAVEAPGAAGSPLRLTLTRSALSRATSVVLLVTGAEKRALLEDSRRDPLPVDALFTLPARTSVFWTP